MKRPEYSVEELLEPIRCFDYTPYLYNGEASTLAKAGTTNEELIHRICDIYHTIRPFIHEVCSTSILSEEIKLALGAFVGFMDTVGENRS